MNITICGSMQFHTNMVELEKELRTLGHDVRVPDLAVEMPAHFGGGRMSIRGFQDANGGVDAFPVDHEIWKAKGDAMRGHLAKIDWADAILVANYEKKGIPGYIGANTFLEMGYAFGTGKNIFVLNPFPEDSPYKEELLSLRCIVLDGNLGEIR